MTTRALVLGGGGNVGVAWETAVLAGLLDGGLDARAADLVIGTSAGAIVGTWVAHGHDLHQRMRDRGQAAHGRPVATPRDPAVIGEVFRLWGSFDEMTPERCAQVGALALEAPTASQEEWLAGFIDDGSGWPEKPLLIVAVDCDSGQHRIFSRPDGVPINVACAASCAVPGLFPPVEIEGRRYTDGGVRSWTSADLTLAYHPDCVLIIAPAGVEGAPGVRGLAARQVAREMAQLRAAGVDARLITFDEAAQLAGQNLMDPFAATAAAEAGLAHANRIAHDFAAWWDNR
jgi:NTE family protein